jgi:TetR/AcrR family tetracycline transcriptional repressor
MPLTRDEVLKGALRLLDDEGLEALTMRRLARALGVQAGAIYWHFVDKQALYDAMVEHSFAGLLDEPLEGSWDRQLAEITRRIAARLVARRDGALLATKALHPGPNSLAVSEKMLAIARGAGFSKPAAISATSVLGYYVLGYVTDVQATQAAKKRGLRTVLRSVEKILDRSRFPELASLGARRGLEWMTSSSQARARFDFGLAVILDGLRRALPPRPKRR